VAAEEKVVLGGNGERVSHEGEGVDDKSTSHRSRDAE
jgi:hypothetical protein